LCLGGIESWRGYNLWQGFPGIRDFIGNLWVFESILERLCGEVLGEVFVDGLVLFWLEQIIREFFVEGDGIMIASNTSASLALSAKYCSRRIVPVIGSSHRSASR
jgi:hypothetical protein